MHLFFDLKYIIIVGVFVFLVIFFLHMITYLVYSYQIICHARFAMK